jgi:cell division protein FtsB
MNKSTNRLLAFVVVLQVMILGSLFTANTLPVAQAQIPDPGAQRERQLDELKQLNAKMDKLIDLLGSGKVQVVVAGADKK